MRDVLGQGGIGVVVRAHDRVLNEEVAIKLLRSELVGDRRWRERLAREVKIARQIRHPNVCRVFDFGQTDDGQVFLVMELANETLRSELDRGAAVARTAEERLADASAVAAGLAAIHEAGIVHRDVNPRNVLRCADGRLVVSDFGLAIDVEQTTASLQGGTVAYMAPELAFGGRASFASDVWSLGIVIHEITFGRRPSWDSPGAEKGIKAPASKLGPVERILWDLCRACTQLEPRRLPTATAVLARLSRLRSDGPTRRWRRRGIVGGASLVILGLAALGASRIGEVLARRKGRTAEVAEDVPLTVRGTPADWTESSRVLARVTGRIYCLMALPDHRTLRFVWGVPRTAEDVNVVTGERRPAPLVPEAYAIGCPDLSPDGRKLIFEGYDQAEKPVIFEASHPDGSGATAVVKAADPDFASAPKWLADGRAFAFALDRTHVGIVEGEGERLTVAAAEPAKGYSSAGWIANGSLIYLCEFSANTRIVFEAVAWPAMEVVQRFAIPVVPSDCQTIDPATIYCNDWGPTVLAIHPAERAAAAIGIVPGQKISFLAPATNGLGFVSHRSRGDLWGVSATRDARRITNDGKTLEAARCGGDAFLLTRDAGFGDSVLSRLERDGTMTALAARGLYQSPVCASAGAEWWFERIAAADPGFFHCLASGCTRISTDLVYGAALSPDGTRIAYVAPTKRGMSVRLMSKLGEGVRDLADSETACATGWASNDTLWVSRRRRGKTIWTEVDVRSSAETGRIVPGGKDCTDGDPDPLSPVDPDLRVVVERQSEVRWQPLDAAPTLN